MNRTVSYSGCLIISRLYLLLFLYRCSYAGIPYAGKLIGIAASFHSLLFSEYSSIRFDIYIYMFEVLFIGCKISTLPLRFIERLSPICHGATNISRAIYFITRMADRLIISFTDILCVYFKTHKILKEFLPTYILILDDLSFTINFNWRSLERKILRRTFNNLEKEDSRIKKKKEEICKRTTGVFSLFRGGGREGEVIEEGAGILVAGAVGSGVERYG